MKSRQFYGTAALLLLLFLVPFILDGMNQSYQITSGLLSFSSSSSGAISQSIPTTTIFVEAQRRRRRRLNLEKKAKTRHNYNYRKPKQQQQPPSPPPQQQQEDDDERNGDFDNNSSSGGNREFAEKHSFKPPFLYGGQQGIPYWEYGGSAIATENYIRVVPNIKSRTGYIWNVEPVHMKSWQVELDFLIHNTHNPGADGLAFWYAREPMKTGTLMGYTESFDGLGILFDTYDNNMDGDNPAVIAIMNHGSPMKLDVDNDFRANQLDRCRADFRNPTHGRTTARITYQNRVLSVYMDTTSTGQFTKCFEINNVHLKDGYYFGITAATGGLADNHDVHSFLTYDLASEPHKEAPESHHHRGWYDPYEEFQKYLEKQKKEEEILKNSQNEPQQDHHDNTDSHSHTSNTLQHDVTAELEKKKKEEEDTWAQEQQLFNDLKEKMKHVDEPHQEAAQTKQQQKPGDTAQPPVQHHEGGAVTFNMQTGLLILEALEEVARTIKKSSTKSDIINILEFVSEVSKKQEEVQRKFTEFSEDTKKDVAVTLAELKRDTDTLNSQLRRLDSLITNIYNDVGNIQRSHGDIQQGISKQSESLGEMQRFSNGWLLVIFIFFQIVFAIGFIYYRKFQESKSKFY
ncbi:hypothetical protein C9374_012665 [Naegleria lovaniensis]|uniref:L-type lectin-like domain-containing protein n=1 Tax=Naegleria lovaniensis TaxID=51637 RepID=A0AA88H074_NAELO|nr:uncharacterized protein C9374_012665 [Naegleria lovaniensis]KAG2392413.1 hypothetical protein C9374_012665 [Naegleria lovaniensis]